MTLKQKQALLAYLGYYDGQLDDAYGPKTKAAVESFQRDVGTIGVDGVAGAETDKALLQAVTVGRPMKQVGKTEWDTQKTHTFWDDIQYIRRDEPFIGCPCGKCGGFPAEPTERLIRAADRVRNHFGAPLIPTSTVRCKEHNAAVGGVKTSRHLEGRAMDFVVKGKGSAEVLAFVKTLGPSYAYAIDSGAVHMDF